MSSAIFLLKRALISLLLLLIASFLVFAGIRATVDPTTRLATNRNPEAIPRERARLHLNEGIAKQYTRWAGNVFSTKASFPFVDVNLGNGDVDSEAVTTKLYRGMNNTFELVLWGMIVAGVLGITFGVIAAINRNNVIDFAVSGFSFLGAALPTFFFGYILIDIFTSYLPDWLSKIEDPSHLIIIWTFFLLILAGAIHTVLRYRKNKNYIDKFTVANVAKIAIPSLIVGCIIIYFIVHAMISRYSGNAEPLLKIDADVGGHFGRDVDGNFNFDTISAYFKSLAMPIVVLAVQLIATWSRYQRSSMIEALQSDYNRTALSKGMGKWRVYLRHAFRNAQLPMVTVIALDLGSLMSGLIVTEFIFQIQGMGAIFIKALNAGDATTLTGFTMIVALFVIGANLFADLIYTIIDPRIRV